MRLTAASAASLPHVGSHHRLVFVGSLGLAAVAGYLLVTSGTWGILFLGGGLFAAFVLLGARDLHLATLPIAFIAPFIGALVIAWPGHGYSVLFDILIMIPFAALFIRWLLRSHEISLFSGGQLLVWATLVVGLFQFLNPDGSPLRVTLYGFRLIMLPMLLFFVGRNIDLSKPGLDRKLAAAFILPGVVVALWGLKQHFWGLTATEEIHARPLGVFWVGETVRVFSTFEAPWAGAAYVGMLGLVSVALALTSRTTIQRSALLGATVLFTATLIFTHVRAVWVGYAVGLLYFGIAVLGGRRMRRTMTLSVTMLAVYAVFAVFIGPALAKHVSPDNVVVGRLVSLAAPLKDASMQDRFNTWEGVWPLVSRYPFGVGLGTTGGVSKRFEESLRFGPIHSDSLYLAAFVEMGWLGGGTLLILMLWIIRKGIRVTHASLGDRREWLRHGLSACTIMVAMANLATPVCWEPGVSHFFWLSAGMMFNPLWNGRPGFSMAGPSGEGAVSTPGRRARIEKW